MNTQTRTQQKKLRQVSKSKLTEETKYENITYVYYPFTT